MAKKKEDITLGMAGATKTHQEVLADFLLNFNISKFIKKYKVLPTTEIAGVDSNQPDITIYSRDKEKETKDPIIIIELIHSEVNRDYSFASILVSFKRATTLKEAFMYNFQTNIWEKVYKDGTVEQTDKSDVLKTKLTPFLKKI